VPTRSSASSSRRPSDSKSSPHSGRAVPEYDDHDRYRELIVGSYRIIYRLESSTVDILTVFHTSRILPGEPPSFE
jgi:plasmid stabilization system protein ParE